DLALISIYFAVCPSYTSLSTLSWSRSLIPLSSLYSPATPPHPHSFPTRRSSDLLTITRGRGYVSADKNKNDELPIGVIAVDSIRSEEHTSELQSRFDLVCRLLLEKKKKYINLLIIIEHYILCY